MPTGIGYKVDPITGERVPYEYVYPTASPQQAPMGGQGLNLNMGALNNVDAEQASEAITAAVKYQGSRGYMQDIQNGIKPDVALSKWAPLMFYSRTSTGGGSLVNALKPNPQVAFTPIPGGGQAVTLGDRLSVVRPQAPAKPPSNFQWVPKTESTPGYFKDLTTGAIRVPGEVSDGISPGAALGMASDPLRSMMLKDLLGEEDYNNLVNKAKSALGSKPKTQPSAPVAEPAKPSSEPVEIKTKADFDKLPSGSIYIYKGKRARKP